MLTERQRRAWKRHNEVGHPEGYDGPCWGPTLADYAYVDEAARLSQEKAVSDG